MNVNFFGHLINYCMSGQSSVSDGNDGKKEMSDREAWEELKSLNVAKGGQAKMAQEQDGNYNEYEGEQFNQGEGDTDKQPENIGPWDEMIGNRKADAGNEARTFLRTHQKMMFKWIARFFVL